jgi:hypothetical protein
MLLPHRRSRTAARGGRTSWRRAALAGEGLFAALGGLAMLCFSGWLLSVASLLPGEPRANAPEFELVHYDLELRIEPPTKLIQGVAKVTLRAGGEPLSEATFALNEALEVTALERDGGKASFTRGERVAEGRALQVAFDPPLAPNAEGSIVFEYRGAGLDPDANGADWMGILLVRDDELRMSHQAQWYPIVPRDERARSKLAAPVELALDLPAGLESLGPGRLTGVKKSKGREIHRWSCTRAVHPSILAGAFKAQLVKRGSLSVRALAFADHAPGAKRWAEDALASLETLSTWLGPLDLANYGLGEMRVRNRAKSYNYEADGFSVYDGVLFDGRAPDAKKIAHEVAHLWFGGAADANGAGERFLTEGLAEFAAWSAVERRSGEAAGTEAAIGALGRYFNSPGVEHSLDATDFASPRYVQVAYAKGAFAVRTLRAWIGAEAFDAGMRAYLHEARARSGAATLESFLAALRAQGAAEVDAWAEDWLRRPGAPRYAVELTGDSSGVLVQANELYRNPLELELTLAGGARRTLVVRPAALSTPWKLEPSAKIASVALDPRAFVLFEREKR